MTGTGQEHAPSSPPTRPGRSERKLRPDEDHRRAARELPMQKYNAAKRGSDSLRPLIYPPMGIA